MNNKTASLSFFILFFLPLLAYASPEIKNLEAIAQQKNLSADPGWHKLLYYQKNAFGRVSSDARDARFFLSSGGDKNPQQELSASITALLDDVDTSNPDEHIVCRFPARSAWLIRQLELDQNHYKTITCPQRDFFREQLNAAGATLIFPAAYLDSPASMFGHTFLRLDMHGQNPKNEILAYTVNYAAEKQPDESEFSLIVSGLLGTHPGEISVIPYYLKLKEYRDVESRDVWEYQLNLSQAEVDLLVDHVWELKGLNFSYSFLKNNCSYRLLALLDVLREESFLASEYDYYAIPVDTIRSLESNDWIGAERYRPSVMENMKFYINKLADDERETVRKIVASPDDIETLLQAYAIDEKKKLLDVAYRYSRIKPDSNEVAARASYKILLERNKLPAGEVLENKPRPAVKPQEGHLSSRAQLLAGEVAEQGYLQAAMRFAYHEFTDPSDAYPRGSSLLFLELEARQYEDDDFVFEHLGLVEIKSLKPRDDFFKPLSWTFGAGATRLETSTDREFTPFVEGQVGFAWGGNRLLPYLLTGADWRISSHLEKGNEVYSSSNIGLVGREYYFQWQLDFQHQEPLVTNADEWQSLSWQSQLNLTHCWTLDFTAVRHKQGGVYWSDVSLGLNHFF